MCSYVSVWVGGWLCWCLCVLYCVWVGPHVLTRNIRNPTHINSLSRAHTHTQGHTIAGTTDNKTPLTMRPEATEEDVQFILESIKDYLNVKVWSLLPHGEWCNPNFLSRVPCLSLSLCVPLFVSPSPLSVCVCVCVCVCVRARLTTRHRRR